MEGARFLRPLVCLVCDCSGWPVFYVCARALVCVSQLTHHAGAVIEPIVVLLRSHSPVTISLFCLLCLRRQWDLRVSVQRMT
eukprot:1159372-Pelagomonas_calceolata.AAC.1